MRNLDDESYRAYCGPRNIEKALNTLWGLVSGVTADQVLTDKEIEAIERWISLYAQVADRHPYSEVIPVLTSALEDRILFEEEKADILWLCARLKEDSPHYDQVTSDLQRLQGMMAGIISDHRVNKAELESLSAWLYSHEHLRRTWPYEEVHAILVSVLADGIVDPNDESSILRCFREFMETDTKKVIENPPLLVDGTITGVCAVTPEIIFSESHFCFTGKSSRNTRTQLVEVVDRHGGFFSPSMTSRVDYLVIGNDGNPCWAYACYGRKIEKAIELRKAGSLVMLVHENDFWDAVADLS